MQVRVLWYNKFITHGDENKRYSLKNCGWHRVLFKISRINGSKYEQDSLYKIFLNLHRGQLSMHVFCL